MKINFICFKFPKVFVSTTCIILILVTSIGIQIKNLPKEENLQISSTLEEDNNIIENNSTFQNTLTTLEKQTEIQAEKRSRTMPEKLKNFEIIGKIEIPKLKLEKYILSESNTKSLKVSVAKLCGPKINKIGNFCIAGHNYNKVFGKIKYLEKNDKIILTDIYGDSIVYQVYDNYKTSPKDLYCLSQDTQSERELTLITCTMGATKRVIIKAVEMYD